MNQLIFKNRMDLRNLCYVVCKKSSNTMYSINCCKNPKIVAFKDKTMATRFMHLVDNQKEHEQQTSTHFPLKVLASLVQPLVNNDHVTLEVLKRDSLARRCSLNGLELIVFDQNGNYEVDQVQMKPNDLIFHLENNLLYY